MSSPDELAALRAALRQYLATGTARPNDRGAAELDRSRWTRLAQEMGVTGVRIPESLGGIGLGLADELLVHEELGRALSDLPYLSSVGFAGAALAALDTDEAGAHLAALAAGDLVVATVLDPDDTISARLDATSAVLDGQATGVVDAPGADALLVAASAGGDPVLAWLPTSTAGVGVARMESLDLTRRFGQVRLDQAAATVLAVGPAAEEAIRAARTNGYLALAAESVGLASRALEMTVDYVKVRHQFGRPIGGFQAVKHRLADMVVELERARSAVVFATGSLQRGEDEARRQAALAVARITCADIPFWIANETIHLHGGIGFTWEHSAHLYYRRAKSNQLLLDPLGRQRRELAGIVAGLYQREEHAS